MHGFSINIEEQTRYWFDQVVACGLNDVSSTSVEAELKRLGRLPMKEGGGIEVKDSIEKAVELFGKQYGRELRMLQDGDEFEETRKLIKDGVEGKLPQMKREMMGV